MVRDIESSRRQQAALALFRSFAFQETDLIKIRKAPARICAKLSLSGVDHWHGITATGRNGTISSRHAVFGWHTDFIGEIVSSADETPPKSQAFPTAMPVVVRNQAEANRFGLDAFYAEHRILSTITALINAHAGQPLSVALCGRKMTSMASTP